MPVTVNVNGSLKTLTAISVNVSGVLKSLSTVHANVSGTLKQIFSAKPADITGTVNSGVVTNGTGTQIATNVVVSTSCTVSYTFTLAKTFAGGGTVTLLVKDSSGNQTTLYSGSSKNASHSGTATLSAGTYSFYMIGFGYSSTGQASGVDVTYSITFS